MDKGPAPLSINEGVEVMESNRRSECWVLLMLYLDQHDTHCLGLT